MSKHIKTLEIEYETKYEIGDYVTIKPKPCDKIYLGVILNYDCSGYMDEFGDFNYRVLYKIVYYDKEKDKFITDWFLDNCVMKAETTGE